jgi:hypothetical protein
LTNVHKIDIFQSTITNHEGGGTDISSFSGKKAWIGKIKDKGYL